MISIAHAATFDTLTINLTVIYLFMYLITVLEITLGEIFNIYKNRLLLEVSAASSLLFRVTHKSLWMFGSFDFSWNRC